MRPPRLAPARVRAADVDAVEVRLAARDWLVIGTVGAVRLATGRQLDQLCFGNLTGRSQTVVRGRVIHRLIRWRVLRSLGRSVGGASGGSAQMIVTLDSLGSALLERRALAAGKVRHRFVAPGERFVRHTLATTQVLADLVTATSEGSGGQIETFITEPGSWWPDGLGGQLKPDAYAALRHNDTRDHWWIETDLATESLPTLIRKLERYVDFARRGQYGPGRVVPRLLVSAISDQRLGAVKAACDRLPDPAPQQIVVVRDRDAALAMLGRLRE
jgi:hypothetical protein